MNNPVTSLKSIPVGVTFGLLIASSICQGQEVPAAIRQYAERSREERVVELIKTYPALEHKKWWVQRARRRQLGNAIVYDSKEAEDKSIETWESELKAYEDKVKSLVEMKSPYFGRLPYGKPKVGMAGISYDGKFEVLQVVDSTSALVTFTTHLHSEEDGFEALKPMDVTVLLKGFDFEKTVDDEKFTLDEPIHFTGTYSYASVSGASRTVLKAEPLDVSPFRTLFNRESEIREWKAKKGTILAEGVIIQVDSNAVMLELKNGKKKKLRIATLCGPDQELLKPLSKIAADKYRIYRRAMER